MNSSYQVNRFYAQERVNAQLKAAEAHRRSRKSQAGTTAYIINFVTRAYGWAGHLAGQAAHSLAVLGEARVASFRG